MRSGVRPAPESATFLVMVWHSLSLACVKEAFAVFSPVALPEIRFTIGLKLVPMNAATNRSSSKTKDFTPLARSIMINVILRRQGNDSH